MTNLYPPKISPTLMTQDPHYIPGYAGYCPQYKYSLGQSYGKLTSKLLTNPGIAHSGQLLLQPNLYRETNVGIKQNQNLHQNYKASRKAQKLTDSMVSGYTGFVPRSKGYFSKTFTETCMDAVAEFERGQLKAASKKQEMELINALQTGKTAAKTEQEKSLITVKYRTPFAAITSNPVPYDLSHSYKVEKSLYLMENEDPDKHFMSGYKGHVPRAQFLLGSGFPTITNRALIEFNQMLNKSKPTVNSVKENEVFPWIRQIYPSKLGMLPQYTGHIPGYKYQFGHTFGHLTQDALGMSTIQKQIVD
ncbi:protein FAM166B-like [Pristis pectinata]|uniref:protein FAM166B-like n=1 Tax=Pristis pectinata TaxID=685728 RepID=UPI00223D8B19|nr:protein FAM166B-like [Pristis pectinata]